MKRILLAWAALAAALPASAQAGYWSGSAAGWYWYEKPPAPVVVEKEVEEAEEELDAIAEPPSPDEPPELAAHRALQRRLEDSRVVAIMDPSPDNVRAYLLAQQEVMDRSARFADVWQRVVWTTPDLDYSFTHRPTNQLAVHSWESQRRVERGERIAQAAREHGLFFVFGPDCLHCAQMARTLERFSVRHGFTVQAVAVGGASHPSFPDAWDDNGFAAAAGIERLPALALARFGADDADVAPIGYGPLADAELEERIEVMVGLPVGERF